MQGSNLPQATAQPSVLQGDHEHREESETVSSECVLWGKLGRKQDVVRECEVS